MGNALVRADDYDDAWDGIVVALACVMVRAYAEAQLAQEDPADPDQPAGAVRTEGAIAAKAMVFLVCSGQLPRPLMSACTATARRSSSSTLMKFLITSSARSIQDWASVRVNCRLAS